MKTIELEELKQIQLDIVQVLHDFCAANDVKYSLACGTLLGAIRHGGYIPWDDDIDVYMEREDYKKFISIFPQSYKGVYVLACLETDKRWHIPYGKLYDNRTILMENAQEWIPIGVNIDIFPVDAVPSNITRWKIYNKTRLFLLNLRAYKGAKPSKKHSFLRNIKIVLCSGIMSLFSSRFYAKIINWYAQCFNRNKKVFSLFENVMGILQKKPFDKADFSETILHKFEDRELCIMKGYDHYLKCGFGNYMQLPPVEKRVSHHSFKAYWK